MKRDCLTTSSKASASQSRNGKYRSARSVYGLLQFFSFSSSSSNSVTNEATFARQEAESARAPLTCTNASTSTPRSAIARDCLTRLRAREVGFSNHARQAVGLERAECKISLAGVIENDPVM